MNRHAGPPDEMKLKRVLREWRGIEPNADFAARVWHRIEAEPAPWRWWPDFVFGLRAALESRTAYAAAAVIVALLWAATLAAPRGPGRGRPPAFAALHGQTLTGAYAGLLMGGNL
jgi:hypothetical protein